VIPFNNDGPGIDLIRNVEAGYQVAAPVIGQGNYVMLPGMTYTWRVRTSTVPRALTSGDAGWSNWVAGTFKTAAPTSDFITASGTPDGFNVASLTPTIGWGNAHQDVFYYEFQMSKDAGFGPDAFLYWELIHGGLSNPPNNYQVPARFPLEPGTTYYWRVRPRVQGDGTAVDWSNSFRFTTPAQ